MGPDAQRARILRHALLDVGADPGPGPLLLPLPAVGMGVVAEVEQVSPVGAHRFSRIALATGDGALDTAPDPAELTAALHDEFAARAGRPAGGGAPGATHAPDPAVADAVTADLTDRLLLRGLLPLVAAGGPDEPGRLDALRARLRTARDAAPAGRARALLQHWLTAAHLWRRPVLHHASWHRTPNPLAPLPEPVTVDPPVPDRAGGFVLRRARPHGADLRTVASWMRRPEVVRFFGQPWSDERWARELAGHGPGSGTAAVLVESTSDPAAGPLAYLELYRPARHALARAHPVGPHDVGVHVCVGAAHRRGTGGALLDAVASALTAAGCPRVLAEPDARNDAARGAFRRAGFTEQDMIALPHKDAVIVARAA
ncbi:GNAT family N-acetyltransferase [Pseudonocardia spirodelae]|uniref:Lysine N-acyltransferase MbtK n=1 Tax=Pseudonocardia spirodelae TaxID=3133431 RepID=A0ABU8T0T8_9PSEU